jgi:hypothetical protein
MTAIAAAIASPALRRGDGHGTMGGHEHCNYIPFNRFPGRQWDDEGAHSAHRTGAAG